MFDTDTEVCIKEKTENRILMLSYTDLYITVSFLLASKTGILSV